MNHATARCGRGSCGANLGPWNASSRPATSSTHLRSLWSPCSVPSDREGGASGDWHDVITLPSGDVVVVVGDAAGHGVQAPPPQDALPSGPPPMAMTGTKP